MLRARLNGNSRRAAVGPDRFAAQAPERRSPPCRDPFFAAKEPSPEGFSHREFYLSYIRYTFVLYLSAEGRRFQALRPFKTHAILPALSGTLAHRLPQAGRCVSVYLPTT
jgi:hypothetical protein